MPTNAKDFVAHLRQWLSDTARTLDSSFPDKRQHVTIGQDGEPVLKRSVAREIPASAVALQQALIRRMPTRNLLDVLANFEHWTHFTRPILPHLHIHLIPRYALCR